MVGIIVALVLYPLLHETAHSLVAVLVGARVIEINLFLFPSVLCDVEGLGKSGMFAIGVSGNLFPYLLSYIIKPKAFWTWYANYIVKGISALAFVLSIISTICFMSGKPMLNDDTTQILTACGEAKWFYLFGLIILTLIATIKLISENPFIRSLEYFNSLNKKTASAG